MEGWTRASKPKLRKWEEQVPGCGPEIPGGRGPLRAKKTGKKLLFPKFSAGRRGAVVWLLSWAKELQLLLSKQ